MYRLLGVHIRHRWILTVAVTRAAWLIYRRIALERRGWGLTAAGHVKPDMRGGCDGHGIRLLQCTLKGIRLDAMRVIRL